MERMKNLEAFVLESNVWKGFLKQPKITFPLSQKHINELAGSLDCKLSPENLHCDGEISAAAAKRKYDYLMRVRRELKAHAKSQGLAVTGKTYEL